MSRASGLCAKCGGPQRARSARIAMPVADCARCGSPICAKHSEWDPEASAWVCKVRCPRRRRGNGR